MDLVEENLILVMFILQFDNNLLVTAANVNKIFWYVCSL